MGSRRDAAPMPIGPLGVLHCAATPLPLLGVPVECFQCFVSPGPSALLTPTSLPLPFLSLFLLLTVLDQAFSHSLRQDHCQRSFATLPTRSFSRPYKPRHSLPRAFSRQPLIRPRTSCQTIQSKTIAHSFGYTHRPASFHLQTAQPPPR